MKFFDWRVGCFSGGGIEAIGVELVGRRRRRRKGVALIYAVLLLEGADGFPHSADGGVRISRRRGEIGLGRRRRHSRTGSGDRRRCRSGGALDGDDARDGATHAVQRILGLGGDEHVTGRVLHPHAAAAAVSADHHLHDGGDFVESVVGGSGARGRGQPAHDHVGDVRILRNSNRIKVTPFLETLGHGRVRVFQRTIS